MADMDDTRKREQERGWYIAWNLAPEEEASCYFCMQEGDYPSFKRGEVFLVGPEHPPYDANANYVCKRHLSPGFKIEDPEVFQV